MPAKSGGAKLSSGTDLTKKESAQLKKCETQIFQSLKIAFYFVGSALREIRDKKLYRSEFKTFEEYGQVKWQLKRHRLYQLINSATVVQRINDHFVDHGQQNSKVKYLREELDEMPIPTSERHVRELLKLPEERQPEVWTDIVVSAYDSGLSLQELTAKDIKERVSKAIEMTPTVQKENASRIKNPSKKLLSCLNRQLDDCRVWIETSQPSASECEQMAEKANELLTLIENYMNGEAK